VLKKWVFAATAAFPRPLLHRLSGSAHHARGLRHKGIIDHLNRGQQLSSVSLFLIMMLIISQKVPIVIAESAMLNEGQ
jgi:hypothetical protein